jgi:LysM repeat protein
MGYWGWRPLVVSVFMSVWVVGCNIVTDISPSTSPTTYPPVTLTVGRLPPPLASPSAAAPRMSVTPVQTSTPAPTSSPAPSSTPFRHTIVEGDTLLDLAIRYGVELAALRAANADLDLSLLQVGQPLVIPLPTSAPDAPAASPPPSSAEPLIAAAPACYPTRGDQIVCLGAVDNALEYPVEQVDVRVDALGMDGAVLAAAVASIEQALIPGGSSAPYRASFALSWDQFTGAAAAVERAVAAVQADARFAELIIEDEAGVYEDGRYRLTAAILNPDERPVAQVRAVVTLVDDAERVIGYRVVMPLGTAPLGAGERIALQIDIIPQIDADRPRHRLYVEGLRGQ